MGVVIGICTKQLGGRNLINTTDMVYKRLLNYRCTEGVRPLKIDSKIHTVEMYVTQCTAPLKKKKEVQLALK
jgi:hypothetical protein